mgnify:CR=1 FL=1
MLGPKRQRQPTPTTKTKENSEPRHRTTHQPQRLQNRPRWLSVKDKVVDALHGIDSIIERFDRLAKKWAPRPRKPRAET